MKSLKRNMETIKSFWRQNRRKLPAQHIDSQLEVATPTKATWKYKATTHWMFDPFHRPEQEQEITRKMTTMMKALIRHMPQFSLATKALECLITAFLWVDCRKRIYWISAIELNRKYTSFSTAKLAENTIKPVHLDTKPNIWTTHFSTRMKLFFYDGKMKMFL